MQEARPPGSRGADVPDSRLLQEGALGTWISRVLYPGRGGLCFRVSQDAVQRLGKPESATLDPSGSRMGGTGVGRQRQRRRRHICGWRVWSQLWGGGRSPGASPSPNRLGSYPVPARGGEGPPSGHPASEGLKTLPPPPSMNIHERRVVDRLHPHIPNVSRTFPFYSKVLPGVRIRSWPRTFSYWPTKSFLFVYATKGGTRRRGHKSMND